MTRTLRNQRPQSVELAPDQIYLLSVDQQSNPIQTIVEGYVDWSYRRWDAIKSIGLFYKGRYVTSLRCHESGGLIDKKYGEIHSTWPLPAPSQYANLEEAVQHYLKMPERLSWIDEWNKADGLEPTWCIRQSFTPSSLPLSLSLPPQERKRIERLAEFENLRVDQFLLKALYASLPAIEERYNDYYRRYPEERAIEEEAAG